MTESIVNAIRTIPELRAELAARRAAGASVALVPTMGALHAGHCALIERAAAEHEVVVVSIFVNPTQFNDAADLANYPRNERRDIELATGAGATFCFVPAVDEIYPTGAATSIHVSGRLTETLEGAERGASHFDGMATVVTALLNITAPQAAYFGAKDAQQALVVQRFVTDLHIATRIITVETVRDQEGLALSSRNARLSDEQRERALALSAALRLTAEMIAERRAQTPEQAIAAGLQHLTDCGLEPEYLSVTDAQTLAPATELRGELLIACAARLGEVRLIDNLTVNANREAATVQ